MAFYTELEKKTGKEPVQEQLRRRKCNWLGETVRCKSDDDIDSFAKQTSQWTPQGRRGTGRPRNTWKKDLGNEMWMTVLFRHSWRKMESVAPDRAVYGVETGGALKFGKF